MFSIYLKSTRILVFSCFFFGLLSVNCLYGQENEASKPVTNHFKFKTLIIDAGHGGKDPGAHGATSKEKDIALSIAKKLRDLVNNEMPGVKTIMTRSTDTFIELHRRTEIANSNHGNLFISIHCNSSPQKGPKNMAPWYWFTVFTAARNSVRRCVRMLPFLLRMTIRINIMDTAMTMW